MRSDVDAESAAVAIDVVDADDVAESVSDEVDLQEQVSSSGAEAGQRFLASGAEAGTAPEDRSFRPDVEGLRGVAIALVVLYHDWWLPLNGGFVGVDVFFVISGFVITGLLLRERAATHRTRIVSFYSRRIRRIVPMATLVILAALITTHVMLSATDTSLAADDSRWALVFLANVHFSHAFPTLALTRPPSPIQTYWSLAVEEQF